MIPFQGMAVLLTTKVQTSRFNKLKRETANAYRSEEGQWVRVYSIAGYWINGWAALPTGCQTLLEKQ